MAQRRDETRFVHFHSGHAHIGTADPVW